MDDNRQRKFFQQYVAPRFTLATTSSQDPTSITSTEVFARIRVIKGDRRLPITLLLFFEPEKGNPDMVTLNTGVTIPPSMAPAIPKVAVAELMLANRAYVPVVRNIGTNPQAEIISIIPSRVLGRSGAMEIPSRGSLGFAYQVASDCDAIDLQAYLYCALGERIHDMPIERYYGGRWTFTYAFTVSDRLSREEWEEAVLATHASHEVQGNAAQQALINQVPILVKMPWGE